MGNFNPQVLANTAWAFATLGQADAQLFTALAREAERRVGNFNPQDPTNTAWAFATLGQPGLDDFNPQELANTAWAFATLSQVDA